MASESILVVGGVFAVLWLWCAAPIAFAQAASHFLGTITAIDGNALTIKTAQGDEHGRGTGLADLKRVEPGQTSLSAAVPMQFSELAVGIASWCGRPNSPAGSPQATRLVAIKAVDLAKKHEQEASEWQRNGVGGSGEECRSGQATIVITSGAGPAMHPSPFTPPIDVLKRYAPASVNYARSQPAPIDTFIPATNSWPAARRATMAKKLPRKKWCPEASAISPGSLLRSMRDSTFTLKDLATKKMVTVKVPQMRKCASCRSAWRSFWPRGSRRCRRPGGKVAERAARPGGGSPSQRESQHGGGGDGLSAGSQPRARDSLSDLKNGDAVMLVATPGDRRRQLSPWSPELSRCWKLPPVRICWPTGVWAPAVGCSRGCGQRSAVKALILSQHFMISFLFQKTRDFRVFKSRCVTVLLVRLFLCLGTSRAGTNGYRRACTPARCTDISPTKRAH